MEAEVVNAVEKYMSLEEVFPEDSALDCNLPRYSVTSEEDSECAAQWLRSRWNLGGGPLGDLVGRLEDNCIKIVEVQGVDGFDGFSCWANGEQPVIAFNRNMPGDRQRFSVSHELGHLVLQVEEQSLVEMVANRFAAALLVPREAALSELGSRRENLSFEELMLLKQEYGVSIQSWIRRAHDLNIISTDTYSALFRRLSSMGWRTCEPNGIPAEKPRRLRLLVHRALAEDLITDTFAAKVLGEVRRSVPEYSDRQLKRDAQALATVYENDEELTWLADADLEEAPDDRTERDLGRSVEPD
ncbi:MAG: ImmA/IrrE family metallo-endopeptidase [Bacillota bacterium]